MQVLHKWKCRSYTSVKYSKDFQKLLLAPLRFFFFFFKSVTIFIILNYFLRILLKEKRAFNITIFKRWKKILFDFWRWAVEPSCRQLNKSNTTRRRLRVHVRNVGNSSKEKNEFLDNSSTFSINLTDWLILMAWQPVKSYFIRRE